MRPTTLCFPLKGENKILLGRKRRGFGADKYNGFGGKLEEGESFRQGAVRELAEEASLLARPEDLEVKALLEFRFPYEPELTHVNYVYFLRQYKGLPLTTEEMEPAWFSISEVPYEQMWKGDRVWLRRLLAGEKLEGHVTFGEDNETVIDMELRPVDEVKEDDGQRVTEDNSQQVAEEDGRRVTEGAEAAESIEAAVTWPNRLLEWFEVNRREELPWRRDHDPYRIWVSEIMLQQTRVETVKPYFENWLSLFPTPEALAEASEDDVLRAWQGLGYYNRARNLQLGVREVVEQYSGQMPTTRKAVEALHGVGPYTAGAILSIAFNQPEPAVDGNVLRVYARLYGISEDILKPAAKKQITSLVQKTIPPARGRDFNEALMDFGATLCMPKSPKCTACPLQQDCLAFAEDKVSELPVRNAKRDIPRIELTVVLLRREQLAVEAAGGVEQTGKNEVTQIGEDAANQDSLGAADTAKQNSEPEYLLHRRPDTGLLRSMWEFPAVEGPSGKKNLIAKLLEMGLTVHIDRRQVTELVHTFSHRQWIMKVYRGTFSAAEPAQPLELPPDWRMVSPADFDQLPWAGPHGKLTVYCSETENKY